MEKPIIIINFIANLYLYSALLNYPFNFFFPGGDVILTELLWLVLLVALSAGTTILTFSVIKKALLKEKVD